MVFWIFVIIGVIGAVVFGVCCHNSDYRKDSWIVYETGATIGGITCVIALVVVVSMLIVICLNHASAIGKEAGLAEKHKAITYKLESGACVDEFGLLSKEIMDEVQEYNVDVAKGKALQNSFWMGILFPDIYDDLKLIEYDAYAWKQEVLK